MTRKVILDVDTGVDDALALLLAARTQELDIVGVTCVAGNATLPDVVRNTLAVMDVAGIEAPVAAGASRPMTGTLLTASYFHGENGLADIDLPRSDKQVIGYDAATFLLRAVREQPNEITVVAVGPLTNLALALQLDPGWGDLVRELIIMGGAVCHPGNASPAAEANFRNDPVAAALVVGSGTPLTLVDLAATRQGELPAAWLSQVNEADLAPPARLALQLLNFYAPVCMATGAEGPVLHDPLAVALAAWPALADFLPMRLEVETSGRLTNGACVANFSGMRGVEEWKDGRYDVVALDPVPFNVSLARNVQTDRFLQLFMSRLGLSA